MKRTEGFGWLAAAALGAYACSVAVPPLTPIDAALPLVAVAIALAAWSVDEPALLTAVPLLIIAAVCLADERLRLLAYGLIAAITLGAPASRRLVRRRPAGLLIALLILLRLIPFDASTLWREAMIALAALLILHITKSPYAAALIAAATPTFPLKPLILPFLIAALLALMPRRFVIPAAILIAAALPFARYSLTPLLAATALALLCAMSDLPARAVALLLVTLFAWSGVAIHAMPPLALSAFLGVAIIGSLSPVVAVAAALAFIYCMPLAPQRDKQTIGVALAPSQSLTVPVAPTRSVVLATSGANVSAMKRATLANVDALDDRGRVLTSRTITLGDVADWGFMRREHLFASRNRLPHDPTWRILDYGAASWVYGAGRVEISAPKHIEALRITAAPSLPAVAQLQVESVETPRR